MKLASKIAASVALLGALTVSRAESVTFGVDIAPIASLVVHDGILKSPTAMVHAAVDATPANSEQVGGFTVITNMPRWNVYFGFANGGALMNQTGRQVTNTAGAKLFLGTVPAAAAATAGEAAVFLNTPDVMKVVDQASTPLALLALAATATGSAWINNSTNNTLTAGLTATAVVPCTGAVACTFTTPWLTSTDLTTANFNIRTGLQSATALASVAGTYTETMYMTLVATY